jgi:uncharacterized protein
MWRTVKRVVFWALAALVVLFAINVALNWTTIQRVFLGGVKIYETTPPAIPADLPRPAILVFSKTNGFRHEEAIPAANALFAQMAKDNGWGYFHTENGATFRPDILSRFDAVVFNNVSGDVFTPEQRQAFRSWLEGGGGYVGLHSAGDNSHQAWGWYQDELIGARFTQHTMDPQFQQAVVHVEDKSHPATEGLPPSWRRTEEWYSFEKSPRGNDHRVLITVDERTYKPEGMFGKDLRMGDHPMVWWRCVGRGRALYSAFGHRAEAFAEPEHRTLLQNAVGWALGEAGDHCRTADPAAQAGGTK